MHHPDIIGGNLILAFVFPQVGIHSCSQWRVVAAVTAFITAFMCFVIVLILNFDKFSFADRTVTCFLSGTNMNSPRRGLRN